MTTATENLPANNGPAKLPAKPNPVANLRGMLEKSREQIALALPKHLTAERMIRVALSTAQRTPALLECTPLSFLSCVMAAAELGLELSGPLGQAYLIPRKNTRAGTTEATFQIGYRGLIALAFRSGQVGFFNAHEVRANDEFHFEYGTEQRLVHRPALRDRGEIVAFYAVFKLKDGAADFEVMPVEDINRHRDRYSLGAKRSDSPWQTAYEEMAKKTVLRRLSKRAPISIELTQAAAMDEYGEVGAATAHAAAMLPPSEGRHSLQAPRVDMEVPPDIDGVDEPPPPDVQPSPEDIEREDAARQLEERIAEAEDETALKDLEAEIAERGDYLGDDRCRLLREAAARKRGSLKPKRGK